MDVLEISTAEDRNAKDAIFAKHAEALRLIDDEERKIRDVIAAKRADVQARALAEIAAIRDKTIIAWYGIENDALLYILRPYTGTCDAGVCRGECEKHFVDYQTALEADNVRLGQPIRATETVKTIDDVHFLVFTLRVWKSDTRNYLAPSNVISVVPLAHLGDLPLELIEEANCRSDFVRYDGRSAILITCAYRDASGIPIKRHDGFIIPALDTAARVLKRARKIMH